MDEKEKEVKIDYQGIIQQLTDKVIVEFVGSFMPDEKTKKLMTAMVSVHRKYGIDAATSLKILMDYAELIKEVEEDK